MECDKHPKSSMASETKIQVLSGEFTRPSGIKSEKASARTQRNCLSLICSYWVGQGERNSVVWEFEQYINLVLIFPLYDIMFLVKKSSTL